MTSNSFPSPTSQVELSPIRKRFQASRIFAASALVLLQSYSASWAAGAVGGKHASGLQHMHNTVPAAVSTAKLVGPTLRLQKMDVSFQLPLRNLEALTNTLADIYNPASPNFHHFLSQPEFTERFGPSQSDYDAVVAFAKAHHLDVIHTLSNRLGVTVHGTVFDVQSALHVQLNEYQHPTENRIFRSPDREPSLDLAVPLSAIAGLDTFYTAKPKSHYAPVTLPANGTTQQNALTGSGPSGLYGGLDFRKAYCPGITNTGAGQSLGLVELQTGYLQSDITAWENLFGLPNVTVTPVLIDGFGGAPSSQGQLECTLDIQMAISMAPGLSSVRVYEANSIYVDSVNTMASENLCKTLSSSWGWTGGASLDPALLEMAAQGQSFFDASGDSGAYAPGATLYQPDGDPNVTMVGGTSLTTSGTATESYVSEAAWGLSGGGIASGVTIPSWQQGVATSANYASTTLRSFPDVAMNSTNIYTIENGTGYQVYGTSASAPLWAAYVALANQLAASKGLPPVGFLNPTLYAMGKGSNAIPYTTLFHDIVGGNNGSATQYPAVTGYDLVTGWGSPNTSSLFQQLGFPEALTITPAGPVTFSGPAGGPFSPSAATYTLTDTGVAPLNWALPTPPSWLDISTTGGTLTNGVGSTTVTVSIDPSATNLANGLYTTALSFTNLNDNVVQTFTATLAIVTAPVITSQPTNVAVLAGQTVQLSVGVATNALVYYQWQTNGVNLTDVGNVSGSATPTLTIKSVTTTNAGNYTVIVSNVTGIAVSSNASLAVIASAPVIVTQPTNFVALPAGLASFSVSVIGSTPYRYWWQLNGTNLVASSAKSSTGVTNATLALTNVLTAAAGNYSVLVSNSLGSVTSSVVTLSLTPVTAAGYALNANASFTGGTSVQNPYAGLVYVGSQSAYFGTSLNGGSSGGGCTFKVTVAGTVTREHSFGGSTDGAFPIAPLCLTKDNNLYGVTYQYGTYSDGALWRQSSSSATLTALVQFNGDNGDQPVSGLMQAADNLLYGAANAGGAYGYGTIFRCATNASSVTTLASFNGLDGAYPSPILVQTPDGNLYGTCENGGIYASGAGTVFRISTNGLLTVLYNFNGTNDGAVPIAGLTLATDGNLYGTTLQGGTYNQGTVFKITTAGVLTTLYSFTGGTDGAEPWAGLIQATNGNLYGVTQQGGTYNAGTVFQIAPNGSLTTIAQFDGYQGSTCEGNLVQGPDGNLYGATFAGGLLSNGAFISITNFGALQITGQPLSQSVYVGGNTLFTVATSGNNPTLYQWQLNGTNLVNGVGITGANSATLVLTNVPTVSAGTYSVIVSNVYGAVASSAATLTVLTSPPAITSQPVGATNLTGGVAIFSVAAAGNAPLSYFWQLNGTSLIDGGNLSGSSTPTLTITNLTLANSGVYSVIVSNATGVATSSNAILAVYLGNLSSVTYTNLHFFTNGPGDGVGPDSALIQGLNGNLYGTASSGGANYVGTIFKTTMSGTPYTNSYSFVSTVGSYPNAGLVQYSNGVFYGTAQQGGANTDGSLFQVGTNGITVTLLHSFAGAADGQGPDDSLMVGNDGNLYGTAYKGGSSTYGSVFQMLTNGTVNVFYNFTDGSDGANPIAGVIQGADGNFYGTATIGGKYGYGTAYKVGTNGTFVTLVSFNNTNGAAPDGGLVLANDGNLYGTTALGGANGLGTVYKLSPSGSLTTIYSFAGPDGADPEATLIQGKDGNLYGSTYAGGLGGQGTVFLITTNGALKTLMAFNGFNGSGPEAALLQASDGNLYGTTYLGGTGYFPSSGGGNGTIFKITLPVLASNAYTAIPATAGLTYTGTLLGKATPPPGDYFSYALLSGPAWLSMSTNGVLTGSPTLTNLGTNLFVIGITDANGFSAQTNLQLVVNLPPPPVILVPANITVQATNLLGNMVFYSVTATDVVDGVIAPTVTPVSGSTFTLGTTLVTATVTDSSGLSSTNTFTVTVVDTNLPVIASQPVSLTNLIGSSASFSVSASAFSPLSYQWWFGASMLSGQTNSTLTVSPVSLSSAGSYYVSVTSLGGTTNSLPATLTVLNPTPPVITVPSTIVVQATNLAGNVVFFSVTATDTVDGVISPVVTPASGSVFPLGTNVVTATATDSSALSATNTFLVIVVDTNLPVIVSQPISLTNSAGTSASFTVTAAAYSPLTYVWSFGTNVLVGQTNSTLTIASVGPANVGSYQVAVSSQGGTTNSAPATLTVTYVAPTLLSGPLSLGGSGFQLTFTGPAGQTYQVLTTSDLTVPEALWTVAGTGTFGTNNVTFTDPNATNSSSQFYIIKSP